MLTILWLSLGFALGAAFIAFARRHNTGERRVLARGLVVAAALYIAFAAVGGAGALWLFWETLGAALYGAAALLGVRYSLWWLALGWALHPAWDVFLHYVGAGSQFTPGWFAVGCVSFDLLVAAYVAVQARRINARARVPTADTG